MTLLCEDSAFSGAAAGGTDAVFTIPLSVKCPPGPLCHPVVSQLLLTGLSYVKLSVSVGN